MSIQIFLAHASEDKAAVLHLYDLLKQKGYQPWLDQQSLIPGQNWREEIPKAIRNSQVFIACLSQRFVSKQGYVQKEFRMALNEYVEKPPDSIYLIPLKLEDCEVPDLRLERLGVGLKDLHWLDYWKPNGFESLVSAIEHQFGKLEPGEPTSAIPSVPSPSSDHLLSSPLSEAPHRTQPTGSYPPASCVPDSAIQRFVSSGPHVMREIASASIGFALSLGSSILSPLSKATKRRAKHTGKILDKVTEQVIASATRFEDKYLYCQASDCESLRSEGMVQREGIFEPLLKDIFVELQIDSSVSLPGFQAQGAVRPDTEMSIRQTIWSLLAASKQQKAYRQLAILAWGGYGKTTLLKHVAYRYGIGEAAEGAPKLVSVLLVLRKYRKHLLQATPPTLPELINQHHIPSTRHNKF